MLIGSASRIQPESWLLRIASVNGVESFAFDAHQLDGARLAARLCNLIPEIFREHNNRLPHWLFSISHTGGSRHCGRLFVVATVNQHDEHLLDILLLFLVSVLNLLAVRWWIGMGYNDRQRRLIARPPITREPYIRDLPRLAGLGRTRE